MIKISLRTVLPAAALSSIFLAGAVAGPANATVVPRQAHLEGPAWSEFDQTNASTGSLTLDKSRAYDGVQSAKAVFNGGANGYSRGIQNVDWQDGDDVWYGSAFYLPPGFKASMQGQVDLLRWDNFTVDETNTDRSGIILYNSDKKARIMRQKLGVEEVPIAAPFDIPEGRWFYLEVHQHLSQGGGALSEVFLDGAKVASSTQPNTYGRGVSRVRSGIVAINASQQKTPLTLWFDRVTVSTTQVGPLGGTPASSPAPAPTPAPAATPSATPAAASPAAPAATRSRATRVIKQAGAAASSRESSRFGPRRAIDGKTTTRWSSKFADKQWWRSNLGRVRAVSGVQVNWQSAYASRYAIEVSKDGRTWSTAAEQTASGPGTVKTTFRTRPARYVRIRSITRGTHYGISFWDAKILRATG
ncbi:MAG: glycoside hydrolase family 5 [Solirubrobacterales bacterium]|nr:glycoside hydrolase family 5 [Solirubrobacterales bacterium]